MKKIIHTFALLLIVQVASIANTPFAKGLNGKWFDEFSGQDINIKQYGSDHLEVKNLFNEGWVTYWNVGYGKFKDNRGNLIRANSRSKITVKEKIRLKWSPDTYNAPIYFFKGKRRNTNQSNSRSYDRSSNRYDRNYGNSCGPVTNRGRNSFSKYSAVGEWYSNRKNLELRIKSTARGIKVRRSNQNKWVNYDQDNYNEHVFVNDRGSRYVFDGNGQMSFEGFDGKRIRFNRN